LVCWKLVRDGVGRELEGQGGVAVYRVSGGELEALLRAKIVEEAMELAESGSLEEVADLLEALREWLSLRGLALEDALRAADEKRRQRGGFSGGYVAVWLNREVC